MSYYPVLNAPGCEGWVSLCNFSPNNWEVTASEEKLICVTWIADGVWKTKSCGKLGPGQIRTIRREELAGVVPEDALPLLSLWASPPPSSSPGLPLFNVGGTVMPAWRATLGLSTALASTSYQGELDPFPPQGSLLTFGPFIQFGPMVENYLILLNIEAYPTSREAEVELFVSADMSLRGKKKVFSNSANIVNLDDFAFEPADLPVVICRSMSAIPLYFSKTKDGAFLSLEHTHPPASLVIHGNRLGAQRLLKKRWFSMAAQ